MDSNLDRQCFACNDINRPGAVSTRVFYKEGSVMPWRTLENRLILGLSIIGLIFGFALIYWGFTISYACPVQLVGQPSTCPDSPRLLIGAGVVTVVLSLLGLLYSTRRHKPQSHLAQGTGKSGLPSHLSTVGNHKAV